MMCWNVEITKLYSCCVSVVLNAFIADISVFFPFMYWLNRYNPFRIASIVKFLLFRYLNSLKIVRIKINWYNVYNCTYWSIITISRWVLMSILGMKMSSFRAQSGFWSRIVLEDLDCFEWCNLGMHGSGWAMHFSW